MNLYLPHGTHHDVVFFWLASAIWSRWSILESGEFGWVKICSAFAVELETITQRLPAFVVSFYHQGINVLCVVGGYYLFFAIHAKDARQHPLHVVILVLLLFDTKIMLDHICLILNQNYLPSFFRPFFELGWTRADFIACEKTSGSNLRLEVFFALFPTYCLDANNLFLTFL